MEPATPLPGVHKRTWYVVLNGHRARILHDLLDPSDPAHVEEVMDGPDRTLRDTLSDRPTRSYSSGGSARSIVEPATHPLEEDTRAFLRAVFTHLETAHRADAFDDIVLVAAPRIMGMWRDTVPKDLALHITREIVRNLVALPRHELHRALCALRR